MNPSSSSSPYSNPFYSQPQNPPPPPPPPPLADLSTTLSSLKSLIHVSHQTLHSLSTLLPLKPHNPNHIPCKSPQHHPFYRPSPHPLPGSDQLCFSLDGPASNSLYDEYPGVVRFPNPHAAKKTLTIPGFLSVECATGEIEGLGEQCLFRILPSELLAIRGECEAWSDYPIACSCIVLRALSSGTRMVRERDLMNWVFARSPRYGVVIDVAMADHIFSLFTLCLKAIVREALSLDGDQNKGCPVLVHSLIWFASQLSILYGETNGKLFAIDMLKQCISEAAARGLMMTESPTLKEEGSHSQNELNLTVTGKVISVSQIVAAVAALHDRALFEEKTKGFRVSQPLTYVLPVFYDSSRTLLFTILICICCLNYDMITVVRHNERVRRALEDAFVVCFPLCKGCFYLFPVVYIMYTSSFISRKLFH
jgi:U11/U12 small nuclear ribonucleoprotein SNRNP48